MRTLELGSRVRLVKAVSDAAGNLPLGAAGTVVEVTVGGFPDACIALVNLDDEFPFLRRWGGMLRVFRAGAGVSVVTPEIFERDE